MQGSHVKLSAFKNSALDGGGSSASYCNCSSSCGKISWCPLKKRLVGPPNQLVMVAKRKIAAPSTYRTLAFYFTKLSWLISCMCMFVYACPPLPQTFSLYSLNNVTGPTFENEYELYFLWISKWFLTLECWHALRIESSEICSLLPQQNALFLASKYSTTLVCEV